MQGFRCAVMQQYISTCFYVHIVSYKFATDIDYVSAVLSNGPGGPGPRAPKPQGAPKQPMR